MCAESVRPIGVLGQLRLNKTHLKKHKLLALTDMHALVAENVY